jgi:hypothetical protein
LSLYHGFSLQLLEFQDGAARQPVNVDEVVGGTGAVAGRHFREQAQAARIQQVFNAKAQRRKDAGNKCFSGGPVAVTI